MVTKQGLAIEQRAGRLKEKLQEQHRSAITRKVASAAEAIRKKNQT